jgi:hypothetical protein
LLDRTPGHAEDVGNLDHVHLGMLTGYSDGCRLKFPRHDAGKPNRYVSYSRKI